MVNEGDKQLLDELAQQLADALEDRQKSRAESVPKPKEESPKRQTQKQQIRQLAKSQSEAYSGAKGVIGSVSPQMGELASLGESLAEFMRGIKGMLKSPTPMENKAKANVPPKPAPTVSKPKLPASNVPATGGAPQSVAPSVTVNVEGIKEEIAKHLAAVRAAQEIKADKEEVRRQQREEHKAETSVEKERDRKKSEARSEAYSGTRNVVGALSPSMGGLMDFGTDIKKMIGGIRGMMPSRDTPAVNQQQVRSDAAGLPAPSMGPSTIPTAAPTMQAPQARQSNRAGQTDLARTVMAGGEDNDVQGIREGTLNLSELAASQREEEHVENLPAVEQEQPDIDFNVKSQEELPDKKSEIQIHRQPVSSDSAGDPVANVVGIFQDLWRAATGS